MQSLIIDDTDHLSHVMAARTSTLTRLSDEQGVQRFFNEAWLNFTGRSLEDESGNGWLRSVHPDDKVAVVSAYREATAAHADIEIQYRLLRRDGIYRWMLDRASPWRNADGSFGGLVSACTDVSLFHAPRAVVSPDRRAIRYPSVLVRLGDARRVEFISPDVEVLFGVKAADIVGKTLAEAHLPKAASEVLDRLIGQSVITASDALSAEIEFSLRTGALEHHLSACSVDDGTGSVLILIHDITACVEAKTLQRESQQREDLARQKAESAARARDQFLSVVSHELRSPLNGIQSWTHVLESQIDTAKPIVQRALAGIKTGVTQQVTLIEALLDATQILNGHLTLLPQPYSLNGAIQSALDSLRGEAMQKQIEISFSPDVSDIDMVGDSERVQQIVRHLISNAIKFTDDHGDVRIGVKREGDMAVVSVEDNGSGISPSFVPALFEAFRQVDSSQTRRAAGLGLGLAVSRRIAELHGGSLQCDSEGVGHGATFRLTLPLPR